MDLESTQAEQCQPRSGMSAARRKHLDRTRRRPITDEDLGVVAATMGEPRAVVADMLGRSPGVVDRMRSMVRHGDPRKGTTRAGTPAWTEEEDDLILSLGDGHLSDADLARLFPGRNRAAVNFRRSKLGRRLRFEIGGRTVLAKTCTMCGLLLAGEWFRHRRSYCRKCAVRRNAQFYVDRSKANARTRATVREYQAVTASLATRTKDEYTEADVRVLADPNMSDFEKAVRLSRTYAAVLNARRRRGLPSSATSLSDIDLGEWAIEIRAAAVHGGTHGHE